MRIDMRLVIYIYMCVCTHVCASACTSVRATARELAHVQVLHVLDCSHACTRHGRASSDGDGQWRIDTGVAGKHMDIAEYREMLMEEKA